MPPKKSVKKQVEEEESVENYDDEPVTRSFVSNPVSTVYFSPTPTSSVDRIQLIKAINNFTSKGTQLMEAMESFNIFRDEIEQLDIQINAKKSEYEEMSRHVEHVHNVSIKKLESEYAEKEKMLMAKNMDMSKKLELDYDDKNRRLQNDFKNTQIDIKQKLAEFKLKACEDLAKESGMVLTKTEELNSLHQNMSKTMTELETLRKSYDKEVDKVRADEKSKYVSLLENEKKILQLNANVTNAELKAQTDQQIKEIQVLKTQIETLKHELSEQRNLTKEVAQASAKAQITQSFAK
jgi:hypothetical protein